MEDLDLPASVRGPVEWVALAVLAACLAAEVLLCDLLDIWMRSLRGKCPLV